MDITGLILIYIIKLINFYLGAMVQLLHHVRFNTIWNTAVTSKLHFSEQK